jgi:uncharacterized protein YcnI
MHPSRRALSVVALVGLLVLALAAPASAHVTLRADTTAPGGFAKYTVRVPNESDTGASTTAIEVQLPPGFEEARVQPKPGWNLEVRDRVLFITGGQIGPGQFDEFSFSARNPENPGTLEFPAIQTYSDGTVANWIGPEEADEPAPTVAITGVAPAADSHDAPQGAGAAAAPAGSEERGTPAASTGTSPISWVALIAGLLGLVLGGLAFVRSGKPAGGPAPAAEEKAEEPTSSKA